MTPNPPDMLEPDASRHLSILRALLHRETLTRANWSEAFQDLALLAKEALGAGAALVAFYSGSSGTWSAITTRGELIGQQGISRYGSLSVLERVRTSEQPVLTTADQPLEMTSKSISRLQVENVLAVPLFAWEASGSTATRRLEGCLYLHRTLLDPPFTPSDVALVLDITAILQHHLNLLRRLHDLEMTLDLSRTELEGLRGAVQQQYRLGRYETRDAHFAENVLAPLQGIASADKVAILVLGPTGSGKSYLAQAYHYECARKAGPFVVLDCSQITSAETLAAELFGYAPRSGYANAPAGGRPGKAQLAHRGTLFIDEIACLPLDLQQRLLRLIQTGCFSPMGSSEEVRVDVQIIAATNENLGEGVREKRFREDLYWRIAELVVELPPLSQRSVDIPTFAQKFLEDARSRYGRHGVLGLTPAAVHRLQQHDWARAGNLRGLEHTLNRSLLLLPPGIPYLDAHHLRLDLMGAPPVSSPLPSTPAARDHSDPRSEVSEELETIRAAIRRHGSATVAAEALGMTRDALVWQLRRAGLTVGDILPAHQVRRRKRG